jgi:hypothetical protein
MNFDPQKTGSSGSVRRIGTPAGSWRAQVDKDVMAVPRPIEKAMTPYFITVMGRDGKLLLSLGQSPREDCRRSLELQIFHNKGKVDDGIQVTRSCLRNMLSCEFDKVVCINAYRGYFLAVQTDHDARNIMWYRTNPRYKSSIGVLEYVSLADIGEYASKHDALVGPKLASYLDEVENYFNICREVTKALEP